MNKEDELENEIKEIFKIYIRTKQSYESFLYLSEIDDVSMFWQYLTFISQKDLFIEIDKLTSVSGNQKFRLTTLFNKLRRGGHFQKFNFSEKKLDNWNNELNKLSDYTQKISTLRDEKFGHTDRNKKEEHKTVNIQSSKFKKLLDIIEDIIKTIYLDCLSKDIKEDINYFVPKINLKNEIEKAYSKLT